MTASRYVGMKHKRGTAAAWTARNTILLAGEIGYETDTTTTVSSVKFYKFKIGDGTTAWNSLPYIGIGPSTSGGGGVWGTITGTLSNQLDLQAALDLKQVADADLTAIAALDSTGSGVIASIGAGWIFRTYAQLKTLLNLNNVDNTSDVNKPVSTAGALADAAVLSQANAYTDQSVVGLIDDRGNFDASGNVFPSSGGSGSAGAIKKGDLWTVSVAGTVGGHAVTAGDLIRALVDTPGQTDANWAITENNIGYVAENAANKNASGGYAGLSGFKIQLKNALGTVISFFETAATVARTWTLPDKDGTIAMISDITDQVLTTSDVTDNNVSITKHGFVPKAPNNSAKVLLGDGSWGDAPGGGITVNTTASNGTTTRVLYTLAGVVTDSNLLRVDVATDRVYFSSAWADASALWAYAIMSRNGPSGLSLDGGDFGIRSDGGVITGRINAGGMIIADAAVGTKSTKAVGQFDSTTKGFLVPRMTTTQRDNISSPDEGLIIYNITTHKVNHYNGSAWKEVLEV